MNRSNIFYNFSSTPLGLFSVPLKYAIDPYICFVVGIVNEKKEAIIHEVLVRLIF